MLRIGLTGGTGSGKSTVAARLAHLGAAVVDADLLAREVVEPGTPGLAAVAAEFGPGILTSDGSLDRPAMARLVFADASCRLALEAITHPLIAARTAALAAAVPADGIFVHDMPLVVEKGLGADYHLVVVVHAGAGERVRRLVSGRGMDASDAWSRIAAQASDDERLAAADVWLDNSRAPRVLDPVVDALWVERLVPFAQNLAADRCAPRSTQAVIVEPDPGWGAAGARLVARVRRAVGPDARVEHIGSTAVPGLAGKDCIDLQVVVDDLAAAVRVAGDLRGAGLVRRAGRWWDPTTSGDVDKAMTHNADPGRSVNCHVRTAASPAWRDALLLRDWLRVTPSAVAGYAALKRELAAQPHENIDAYADAKTPWVSAALGRAGAWARDAGWSPA